MMRPSGPCVQKSKGHPKNSAAKRSASQEHLKSIKSNEKKKKGGGGGAKDTVQPYRACLTLAMHRQWGVGLGGESGRESSMNPLSKLF